MASFSASFSSITESSARFSASFSGGDSSYSNYRYVLLELDDGRSYEIRSSSSGGASSSFSKTIYSLDPDTIYYWDATLGYVANGEIVWLSLSDSGSFTTQSARPDNFSWTYSKVSGQSFNLTATEWNNFTSRINEFRVYRGYSNYSFTKAYKGNTFTAAMYNQARKAIQGIPGYGAYIPTVTSGQTIKASDMNILVSELNAIP